MVRFLWSCVLVFQGMGLAQATGAEPNSPNCGIASLINLCELLDRPVSEDQKQQLYQKFPQHDMSMADLKSCASTLGLSLLGVKGTVQELVDLDRPCIVHLQDPAHFSVLLDVVGKAVRLRDPSGVHVQPRNVFNKRASGYALVPDILASPGPRIQLQPDFDFGSLGARQEVDHLFSFTNTGVADLFVTVAGKSCSCFAALVDGEVIAPGETGNIQVVLKTPGFGNMMDQVLLKTNDPFKPKIILTLRGTIDLHLSPTQVFLFSEKGVARKGVVNLAAPAETEVKDISCDLPFVEIGFSPKTTSITGRIWEVMLKLLPDAPVGNLNGTLTIATTHPNQPVLKVPIRGYVQGDLELDPEMVFWGFVKAGTKPQKKEVILQSRTGKPFKILHVAPEHPRIQVTPPVAISNHAWRIVIALDADEVGLIKSQLEITTDMEREETLTIPVVGCVQKNPMPPRRILTVEP